jgi:hypothetical protein
MFLQPSLAEKAVAPDPYRTPKKASSLSPAGAKLADDVEKGTKRSATPFGNLFGSPFAGDQEDDEDDMLEAEVNKLLDDDESSPPFPTVANIVTTAPERADGEGWVPEQSPILEVIDASSPLLPER